jgi:hypothetical protein
MIFGYTCNPFRGAFFYLCKGMIPFWRAEVGVPRTSKTKKHTESWFLFWPNGILLSCRMCILANCGCVFVFLFLNGQPLTLS